MYTEPAVQHSRRYLTVKVRSLLVVVSITGAWMGYVVRQARVQRDAVAAINRAGGRVCYASELNSRLGGNTLSGWRSLIGSFVGIDYVDHVASVDLHPNGAKADCQQAFDRLVDLKQIRIVNLMGPSVHDDVLAQLSTAKSLEILLLQFTGVTDGGLVHLGKLANLRSLNICGKG